MRVQDITIQVRSLALGNIGEIDKGYINDLSVVKRFNNVGSWSFSLPTEYDMAAELSMPGRGIKITGPGWSISGPMISCTHKDSAEDVQGTLFFVGADDMIQLADGQAFPDPAVEDPGAQTQGHDIRTGPAETVMRAYLNANRGPGAPAGRRIDAIALQSDLGRGETITARARFDNLGQLLFDCALQGGGLGFDMVQVGTDIEFKVYEPQDKSDVIRMDIRNDMLTKSEYGYGAPSATRAIVAGQGELEDRKFVQVTSTESLAAEAQWGRKIEHFKDRRDTNEDDELLQEGTAIVQTNGVTIKSLTVTPADDIVNQEFGLDWFLGDKVGVIVDGQPLVSVVTEAVIIMDANGVRVGATLGDPVGFDYDAKLVQAQQNQEKRLAHLEKNSGGGGGDSTPAGTILAWAANVVPDGWLECNGQAVSRTDYADLFAIIGVSYGAGDGSTTFNVPDFQGRVIVGLDTEDSDFDDFGNTGGEKTHILTVDEMPSHTHIQNAHNHPSAGHAYFNDVGWAAGRPTAYLMSNNNFPIASGNATATNQNTGGDDPHNNVQPFGVAKYIIKGNGGVGAITSTVESVLLDRVAAVEETISDKVFFQARQIADVVKSGTAAWSKIPFASERIDVGGCYDPTLSRFIAPTDGFYELNFSVTPATNTTGPAFKWYVNGVQDTLHDIMGYGVAYNTIGATRIFELSAGDYVEVWVNNANNVAITLAQAYGGLFSGKRL